MPYPRADATEGIHFFTVHLVERCFDEWVRRDEGAMASGEMLGFTKRRSTQSTALHR